MTSLLMSSPPIRISHRVFRCIYSNSWDIVASSPSFSRPAAKAPRRAYSQATKFIDIQRKCIFKVTWDQRGKKQFLIWLVRDKENRCLRVPDRIMNQLLLKGWILLDCLQSPVSPRFSVRSSRSSALHYGPPSWMSVKTTYGAEGGVHMTPRWPLVTVSVRSWPSYEK